MPSINIFIDTFYLIFTSTFIFKTLKVHKYSLLHRLFMKSHIQNGIIIVTYYCWELIVLMLLIYFLQFSIHGKGIKNTDEEISAQIPNIQFIHDKSYSKR